MTVANLFCMFCGMKITIDQAVLIFQMILAQHADKTWGDICEMFDAEANEHDRDIKLYESYVRVFTTNRVIVDNKHSGNFLLRFDVYDGKIACFGEFDDGEMYKEIEVKELISIISFEDKV